ncbi:DASH complex subunit ask1 [Orbilia oligospora]|uniref:DASH complex subunit ASK1 n=1 Tax=Orbilia oligospora TaxID=2813651 RepID=A0A8H2DPL8_ORBOL|nr:DASH complex subunit ask1 [Orbilia oligospora]
MSRPFSGILQPGGSMGANPAAPRQLSLTEELERLEQSITLTMQEIDRNFSQCHRIITHSIMPIVDKYAEHSRDVCNNISFWKSFFEDSAEIALGGYGQQEPAPAGGMSPQNEITYEESQTQGEDGQTEVTVTQGMDMTVDHEGDETEQNQERTITLDESDSSDHEFEEEESILASMNLGKARRPESRPKQATKWAAMQSPFDKLKQEVRSQQQQQQQKATSRRLSIDSMDEDESMTPPRLPASMEGISFDTKSSSAFDPPTTPEVLRQKLSRRPVASSRVLDSFEDDDSPFAPQTARQAPTSKLPTRRADPILHQTADTNWRIQATPHKTPRKFATATVTPKHRVIPSFEDSSPMSSPPPPQITTVFSPVNTIKRFNIQPRPKAGAQPTYQAYKDLKTPITAKKRWDTLDPKTMTAKDLLMDDEFDFDDDEDDFKKLGFSPPVTMQFTLPPSKLMQTPAKKASKMLVNDIMKSAGFRAGFAGGDDTQTTTDNSLGDSPSMFRGKSPDFDFDD